MPTPDTSNANVARVLRALGSDNTFRYTPQRMAEAQEAIALADALASPPATPWEERVRRAEEALAKKDDERASPYEGFGKTYYRRWVQAALRAAYPELAPADDRE